MERVWTEFGENTDGVLLEFGMHAPIASPLALEYPASDMPFVLCARVPELALEVAFVLVQV